MNGLVSACASTNGTGDTLPVEIFWVCWSSFVFYDQCALQHDARYIQSIVLHVHASDCDEVYLCCESQSGS